MTNNNLSIASLLRDDKSKMATLIACGASAVALIYYNREVRNQIANIFMGAAVATSGPGVLSGSTNNAASKKESNGDASDGGDAENQQQLMMQQMQQQQQQMQGGGMPGQEEELSAIERFCTDVTDEAKKGLLDPLVGRDDELRRAIHVLSRRTKNNPILLGQSGVGKTAIVEGLAQRIATGDVPLSLRNAKLLELDLGAVGAGCQMPGEFEERLSMVVQEVVDEAENQPVIVFIDDIHNLIPPPPNGNNGSAILKPALGRGLLRCIGCTSVDKFKKSIETDAALERRFQQIPVEEPDVDFTVSILRGLRPRYEQHHNIAISEGVVIGGAVIGQVRQRTSVTR